MLFLLKITVVNKLKLMNSPIIHQLIWILFSRVYYIIWISVIATALYAPSPYYIATLLYYYMTVLAIVKARWMKFWNMHAFWFPHSALVMQMRHSHIHNIVLSKITLFVGKLYGVDVYSTCNAGWNINFNNVFFPELETYLWHHTKIRIGQSAHHSKI